MGRVNKFGRNYDALNSETAKFITETPNYLSKNLRQIFEID